MSIATTTASSADLAAESIYGQTIINPTGNAQNTNSLQSTVAANTSPQNTLANQITQQETLTSQQRARLYADNPRLNQQPIYASSPYEFVNGLAPTQGTTLTPTSTNAAAQLHNQVAFGQSASNLYLQTELTTGSTAHA